MKTQKESLLTKVCESHCPKCGAGMEDIEWGLFEYDEISHQNGTCTKCGCKFREYYNYSNTEWNEKGKKCLNTIKHLVEVAILNHTLNIQLSGQDGKGNWSAGSITTTFHQDSPKGTVEDESPDETESRDRFNAMMDGIESLLLALAVNNVDITNSAFESALQTALDACGNNV